MPHSTVALYEIADMRDILDEWLEETGGELTPEIETLMTELDGKADEKIERVALYIREQLAEAEKVKGEEQRLAPRRKAREKAADSLKLYLHRQMDALGKTKVNGLLVTVALQASPPSVKGDVDPASLSALMDTAPQFVAFTPAQYALNRRAVIDAHKAGLPIPAGLSVEQGTSLRIR